MKFTTITEHQILTLAWNELITRIENQNRILKSYPGSKIASNLIRRWSTQAEEINARIIELEAINK